MKRKFGVLLLLLPYPDTKAPLTLLRPVQAGDKLDGALVNILLEEAPLTVPLSQLAGKKLVLNLFSREAGTLLAVFPTLAAVQPLPHGRVHTILLSSRPWERLDTFLNSRHSSLPVTLPATSPEQLQQLLAFEDKPHALVLQPNNKILAVTEGYYINSRNIRRATGLPKGAQALTI